MLKPAHSLRPRHTPQWHHRRQLRRAKLCALLTGFVLAGTAVVLHGWEPLAVWQSEGQKGDFVGVPYVAEAVETPAPRQAARKVPAFPAAPASVPPSLAVSAELPAAAPLREQELVEAPPEDSEPFSLEAEVNMLTPPSRRPAAEHHRAMAAAIEAPLTPPAYREAPKPPYPPSLRARRISGSVGVRIAVSAEGVPTEVAITLPSGYADFDRSVRNWILAHWRFHPAHKGDTAVATHVQTRIDFIPD